MIYSADKVLRKFGLTVGGAFTIIGVILVLKGSSLWAYPLAVGGLMAAVGLIRPRLLAPLEWAWMKMAHTMGVVMTYVLVTATFYLMITPLGLLMRLFGRDALKLAWDKNTASYWTPVEKDGPGSRPDKPY